MKYEVKIPIPGFENVKEVELVEVDNNFAVLKDEEGNILFTLINPYSMRKDYSFEIPADVKVLLDINENSGVLVYNNVVMKEPITEATVNFKAPFIFNPENKTCAQVILDNEGYAKIGDFVKE
ncbi:MAG: flagellar assembly protein FliW [Epsilonproteobacteria bacterium]|nr:flagellar assembly protein FliW [Campylobacterota bacterium]